MSIAKQNNVRYSDNSISYFTNTAIQNVNRAFVLHLNILVENVLIALAINNVLSTYTIYILQHTRRDMYIMHNTEIM